VEKGALAKIVNLELNCATETAQEGSTFKVLELQLDISSKSMPKSIGVQSE
jgi:hypothetical protein